MFTPWSQQNQVKISRSQNSPNSFVWAKKNATLCRKCSDFMMEIISIKMEAFLTFKCIACWQCPSGNFSVWTCCPCRSYVEKLYPSHPLTCHWCRVTRQAALPLPVSSHTQLLCRPICPIWWGFKRIRSEALTGLLLNALWNCCCMCTPCTCLCNKLRQREIYCSGRVRTG